MSTFFTSDHHYHHKNVIEYCNRPWSFEDQTDELIKRWNSRVEPGDSVYHLGDFSFAGTSKIDQVVDILNHLNGKKYFILGNHDNQKLWAMIEDMNIPDVTLLGHYHEMKIDKLNIILSHYPFREWGKKHYGSIMLHGHCHGNLHVPGERIMDVGIDNHPDHQLFSWGEVKEKMIEIPKPCVEIGRAHV